jgi:SAM-dependent methyltransferase
LFFLSVTIFFVEGKPMSEVCSWRHVRSFDNVFRPLIHKPKKIFGPFVNPLMTVMDVGCGAGWASIGLAGLVGDGGSVLAVDLQQEMLAMVENRARRAGLSRRIKTHQCRKDHLSLNATFDFINAFWMVHEVPDKEAFMKQIGSCMRSGAKFLVAEPLFHVSLKNFEELIELGTDAGLVVYARPKIRFSRSIVFEINGLR